METTPHPPSHLDFTLSDFCVVEFVKICVADCSFADEKELLGAIQAVLVWMNWLRTSIYINRMSTHSLQR
jgi:hypothetical protein